MPKHYFYKKPTNEDRAQGRAMLKSGIKKVAGAVKSYGKNVAGGAKIVAKEVKRKLRGQ